MTLDQVMKLLAQARVEGWYEDHPGWREIDDALVQFCYADRGEDDRWLVQTRRDWAEDEKMTGPQREARFWANEPVRTSAPLKNGNRFAQYDEGSGIQVYP